MGHADEITTEISKKNRAIVRSRQSFIAAPTFRPFLMHPVPLKVHPTPGVQKTEKSTLFVYNGF